MTIKYFVSKFSLHKKLDHTTYYECKKFYPIMVQLKKEAIDNYFKTCFIQDGKKYYFPNFVLEDPSYYRIFLNELESIEETVDLKFSEKFLKRLMQTNHIYRLTIPEYFIDKYKDQLNWEKLTPRLKLNIDILTKYCGYVNWKYLSSNVRLSENIIRQFACNIIWSLMIKINNPSYIHFYHKSCSVKFLNGSLMDISKYISNPQDYKHHSYENEDNNNDDDNDDYYESDEESIGD